MTYKTQLKKRVLAGLLAGTALWLGMPAALAASGAVPNTQLPQGGSVIAGSVTLPDFVTPGHSAGNNSSVTIVQNSQNAVIQWGGQVNGVQVDGGFNVGANATVNFEGPANGYNTLNYDASGNMSQIYGAINANNKGNIYIVNPAGVEISSSAQINVGSLYVSNKKMETKDFTDFQSHAGEADFVIDGTTTDAALMSLGNINAANVTFDGGRIVIDTERLKNGDDKMEAGSIHVRTTDAGQVVLGYNGYDESSNTYGETTEASALASVTDKNGKEITDLKGYMWVEDIKQLQAVNTNLSGQYALRNSIDATATKAWADGGFKPIIGKDDGNDIAFTGKFDGLDYNIFNLNINRNTEGNVGLFSMVGNGAVIRNVTLVGGSIKGQNNVGALAGQVSGGAQISNIMNSASVTGSSNVGGIIGSADHGTTDQEMLVFENLVNTGTVQGASSVGGLIGSLKNGKLSGTSYNLGGVTGKGFNVGGLVGTASNAALGDGTNLIYNRLNVSGAYNVGGIVGSMTGTTVQNAENSGNVTATGYMTGDYYKYHTAHDFNDNKTNNGVRTETVNIANAGGIAGTASGESTIFNVQNSGDVSSGISEENGYTYYTAGNVGGIAGSAVDTSISTATNEENDIRGAHNVGGIAGYFSGKGTITTGINSGGDILATGARNDRGFVKEWVRAGTTGREEAIIGNMGGIAGYMDGDGVYIVSSANRGTVHSQDITGNTVLPVSQAANVGGIVGKIDRSKTLSKDQLGDKYKYAAVSNSYNTGDVRGYMGVGGVAGMMYNGEIAGSYNLGTVNTTRNKDSFGSNGSYYTVNMGGIVGDTTEGTDASAVLYDVYNKGQIGDETFTYYARHVGGIVGRLSGTVEKAYNTGAIYNGYNVVGGIAGWMFKGSITNAFNTGNITVVNNERDHASSQVGGIVGAASTNNDNAITNVYNLGTLRSFTGTGDRVNPGANTVGGIIGIINGDGSHQVSVTNAYTTGNIWADNWDSSFVGSIWGRSEVDEKSNGQYKTVDVKNTYYIRPADGLLQFTDLSTFGNDNSNKAIDFADKDKVGSYAYDSNGIHYSLMFTKQGQGSGVVDGGSDIKANDKNWRIYAGSTPILNAFLPNTENYFSDTSEEKNPMAGISSIQYGTAYDPLLTIIHANTDTLKFDWQALGANNAAGIAVYGAGLTLDNFKATGGSGYFGGMIYSDGALSIESENNGDVALGSASQLYGSSVSISADGNVTIYGNVTATGNGTSDQNKPDEDNSGSISITGGSVDIYGQLTSAEQGKTTFVPGIGSMASDWKPGNVGDSATSMTDIGDRFGYTTGASAVNGNISITAKETASEDGHVNVYYGHQQKGFLDTAGTGNLTVEASGDVYMDSDLSIGGSLSITAGADSEAVLDISNIGQVQATKDKSAVEYLHDFLTHFANNQMTLSGGKQKIAVDMWGTDETFDLKKFDLSDDDTLADHLNSLNITANEQDITNQNIVYIWVSTGEELKNIQAYYEANKGKTNILSYNFALKNDIDASAVTDYVAIGTDSGNGFTGTFDGRDHRIIGLKVDTLSNGTTQSNAGIFDTIGKVTNGENTIVGKVEDLRVYSGTFNGIDNAGAVAGVNYGTISNVTTFGNVVTAKGSSNSTEMSGDTDDMPVKVGAAGGIAGVNAGTIDNASASDAVTAAAGTDRALSTAGGIAGINEEKAVISNSSSDSAVNASAGSTYALGGIAGVNSGTLSNVDSLGVTTGIYKGTSTRYSDNVGGIAGRNSGTVSEAYNESIVSGRDNVGGILGVNTAAAAEGEGSPVQNVSNAARVTGEAASGETSDYVGGLVGSNSGSITNGRNNGEITGSQYVGGLVGNNASGSNLSNLVNDEAASITGDNYVGGIAGSNAGTITADEKNDNLVNRGSITGQMYVGGVAGSNEDGGIITNTISSIALHVKTPYISGQDESTAPKYFGGVVGQNSGTINGATNESSVDVAADGAIMAGSSTNVGGIAGTNTGTLNQVFNTVMTADGQNQTITGGTNVGGIVGSNKAGTVSNAYNTSDINGGTDTVGGIAGNNAGEISTVFTTQENLIANNSENGAVDKGFVLSADTAKNSESYTGFGLTGNGFSKESSDGIWKIYDGSSMALLKVFLTKAKVADPNLVYNGQKQVIGTNSIEAVYGDVTIPPLGQNSHKDAGNYDDWLYSSQIAASGTEADGTFNPNHLGYDIVYTNGNVGIKKAVITVTGNRVDRTYGSKDIDSSTDGTGVFIGGNKDYGFTVTAENTDITDEMKAELTGSNLGFNTNEISDGALNTESGKTTNDVKDGGYTWNTDLTLSGTLKNNYTFGNGSNIDGDKTTVTGNSYVNKATITVDLIDVNRTYGNAAINKTDTNANGNYGVANIEGVTNGDNYKENSFTVNVATDGALDTNPDDKRVTQNAGDYTYTGTVTGTNDRLNNNYNIVVNNSTDTNNIGTGTSTVSKATITVGLNEVERVYGSKDLSVGYVYGISSIDGNTNGDNYDIEAFEFHRDKDNALAGDTEGRVTQNVGEYTYTGTVTSSNTDLNTNYNIIVDENTGKSKVNKADLTITIGDVETTYGTAFDKGSYGYTFGEGDIVNNDTVDSLKAEINAITGGYHNRGEGVAPKETNDAGTYELTFENNLVEMGSTLQNYNIISVKNGTATVNKAVIEVSADDHQIYVGAPEPTYTGTKIEDLLVNGDSLNGTSYEYGPQDPVDTSQTGEPVKIGIHFTDGSYYAAGGDWNSAWDGFKNYEITFKPGTLTIKDLPAGMPDISDSERWNSLLRDTPWDRNENFRERKAEVHFLAGGMTL